MLRFRPSDFYLFLVLSVVLALSGCDTKQTPAPKPPAPPATPVRLLVIDDASLANRIERLWEARSQSELIVESIDRAKLFELAAPDADAIIYPSALIGELASRRWIAPLPAEALQSGSLDEGDILPIDRFEETAWGAETYAVPFGSPRFVLLYRSDIFEELNLPTPRTWKEYQSTIDRLSKISDEVSWRPAVEPLGEGWASQMLLARAASYVRHPSQYSGMFKFDTLEPLIDSPPFVRALEELAKAAELAEFSDLTLNPHEVRSQFFDGQFAMAATWPAATDDRSVDQEAIDWSVANLPGSTEVYRLDANDWERREEGEPETTPLLAISGRLGSVTAQSRRKSAAAKALALIAGKEWSEQIATATRETSLYRHSHLASPQEWMGPHAHAGAAKQYSEVVKAMNDTPLRLFSIRIPGRHRYLAALDDAVLKAVRGESAPQEALAEAAKKWQAISDEMGLDVQIAAYRKSLGLN